MNLQEIKDRVERATAGPWIAWKGSTCHHVLSQDRQFETGFINFNGKSPHDADFIAHARQDIPDLIAEIERLQAAIQPVLEQAELDEAISPQRYDLANKRIYEVILTKEEAEALRGVSTGQD